MISCLRSWDVSESTNTESSSSRLSDLAYFYRAGVGTSELARMFKIARSTVHRRLTAEGIIDSSNQGGPSKRDVCANGHDLNEWGEQRYTEKGTKNGRFCRKCANTRKK